MKQIFVALSMVALIGIGCGGGGTPANVAPTASFTFTPANPDPAATVSFDATASSDSDGTVDSYSWVFAGGTPATDTGATPTCTFATSGFKAVTLTVTDNGGATGVLTKNVPVADSGDTTAPTLNVTGVVLKGTATDNVGVTSLTDGGGNIADTALGGTSEAFTTNTVDPVQDNMTGTDVVISADDAAGNGPTVTTVTIVEDLQ